MALALERMEVGASIDVSGPTTDVDQSRSDIGVDESGLCIGADVFMRKMPNFKNNLAEVRDRIWKSINTRVVAN